MRTTLFSFSLLLFLTTFSCIGQDSYVGSDSFATKERVVDNFSGLLISDGTRAIVRFGETREVIIRVNDNVVDRVRTEVRNDILVVELRNGSYRNVDLSVEVTIPDLSFLRASDGAEIKAENFLGLDELQLEVSDGARITVAGSAGEVNVRASDSGKLFAFGLDAGSCDAVVSDGGRVETTVSDRLTGRISDGGRIFYRGNPAISVSTSDGGRVVDAN